MVDAVRAATTGWKCDAISIGYPCPVVHDHPLSEPHNLGLAQFTMLCGATGVQTAF
jgi:hypothetical protein